VPTQQARIEKKKNQIGKNSHFKIQISDILLMVNSLQFCWSAIDGIDKHLLLLNLA
jgi:hypothetical protein